jgi:hypothetical protein
VAFEYAAGLAGWSPPIARTDNDALERLCRIVAPNVGWVVTRVAGNENLRRIFAIFPSGEKASVVVRTRTFAGFSRRAYDLVDAWIGGCLS